ncbi:flavodoxin [Candidatus Bipolaricaulota bacterium]|nr:flavodoxin [Candidatus Bipolaricaulota bacterium]
MKIGIVVYSQTGHTLSVAEELKRKLDEAGHSVSLEQVSVVGGRKQGDRAFELDVTPGLGSYEALVLGSAVEAFSLSPVLSRYLEQLDSLQEKRVACLVTQQFPYPWMGGNRAIRQMVKLCESKGASVCGAAIVNWAQSRRETTTAQAIAYLAGLF